MHQDIFGYSKFSRQVKTNLLKRVLPVLLKGPCPGIDKGGSQKTEWTDDVTSVDQSRTVSSTATVNTEYNDRTFATYR